MASDANGEEPTEPTRGDRAASRTADDRRDEEPAADETAEPVETEVDALLDAADEPAEIAAKGRPGLFLTLTCGFLVLMCCVMGTFGGGSLLWMRTMNLDEAMDRLGQPRGWTVEESSLRPWRAEARLRGPGDVEAVRGWLADLGAKPSADRVEACLTDARPCTVEGRIHGFDASVEYNGSGTEAAATVQID